MPVTIAPADLPAPHLQRRQLVFGLAALLPATFAWGAAASTPPALMLAKNFEAGTPLAGFWVSEKYDGVRGYWDGRQLLTRGGNPIAAPAWFTAGWPATPLDGELWAGRGQFSQAVSTVRQQTPDDAAWRAIRFMVFDLPVHSGTFAERLPALQETVARIGQTWVQAVAQSTATTAQALQTRLTETVRAGGEGLMLHRGAAHYRAQRSDDLRKLKPFVDAEARVVGHVAGQGKHAGRLGALWLELPQPDGRAPLRFKLGTGFSDPQRTDPPAVGQWVTFRYRGETAAGVPRFASFLRVAPDPAM
ncbi:DNA ligase [Rhodoferax saidenbachensis]|uniref:DNA ligase n=1 Tax=Rhodoferax saidenbachensis TaxID=1484693 RepID=A0A1P8K5H6_9BURK|nr:DNA ligase [Rhodoferax saidenbachensis]APW41257.1 DNA ligase [Rhodoferax saidenbachensis]